MLTKVISGGQTGADIAGLIAAKECGLETGGTAPKKFMTENGSNLDLKNIYHLVAVGGYKSRTIKNVCDSDGTIAFIVHNGTGGTSKTIGYCKYGKWIDYFDTDNDGFKPVLVIDAHHMELKSMEATCSKIIQWLNENQIKVLNIAGHRQSTAFQKPFYDSEPYDYQQRVVDILVSVFNEFINEN